MKNLLYNNFMKYVLASSSPRRIEFFSEISKDFVVCPSNSDENLDNFFTKEEQKTFLKDCPEKLSIAIAKKKANDVFEKFKNDDAIIVGADTGVFIDGEMIGKAKSEDEGIKLLKKLSGRTHEVITGYVIIYEDRTIEDFDKTKVTFENLSDDTINTYIKSGLYKGKAGAYGIQDGYPLVKEISGDFKNVMGFPLKKIKNDIERIKKCQQ